MPYPVYRPHVKQNWDVEIMYEARSEARRLPSQEDSILGHEKPQIATDELVHDHKCPQGRRDMFVTPVVGYGIIQETDAKSSLSNFSVATHLCRVMKDTRFAPYIVRPATQANA